MYNLWIYYTFFRINKKRLNRSICVKMYIMSKIVYTIKKSAQAKRLSIKVYQNGKIVVTQPKFVFDWQVGLFIKKNAKFLQAKQAKIKTTSSSLKNIEGSYANNKARARKTITETVEKMNQHYGFDYNRIAIRDTKTRWGSCSSKMNLNFSYKLLFLPDELRHYIVTHELCHLQQMNHSKIFWNLVEETVPEYKQNRRELRKFVL